MSQLDRSKDALPPGDVEGSTSLLRRLGDRYGGFPALQASAISRPESDDR